MGALAHVEVLASHGDVFVPVLVDLADYERLGGRGISIGSHGYPQVWVPPTCYLLHRWVLDLSTGDRRRMGDHRNRDVLDCRRRNLRVVDASTSNVNRTPSDGAGVGAYRTRYGKWQARVQWRRERIYLGTFIEHGDAIAAVQQWRDDHPETRPPERATA